MTPEERATAKGAKFEQIQDYWIAKLMRRGRVLPLAVFRGTTKREVAEMWLVYTRN